MEIENLKKQVERQVENPDWDKIMADAKKKEAEFEGMVSAEGAIHIALQKFCPEFKLSAARMIGSEVKGRLVNKTKPRFVDTKNVKNQAIRDVFIATEEMGVLGATLWGKTQVELFKDVDHGDAVLLKNVKVAHQDGEAMLRVFKNSEVEKLGEDSVKPMQDMLIPVDVSSVKTSEIGVLKGLVVKTENVKYDSCPQCGGRLSEVEDTYHCKSHGEVAPIHKEAVDVTFDAGGNVVSSMLWPELLEGATVPKQFDVVSMVCRVYDSNFFGREKARKASEVSGEVLEKQFPRDIRVTTYSFGVIDSKAQTKNDKGDEKGHDKPPSVEDIEDAE